MPNNIAFARNKTYPGRPAFLVDRDAVVLDTGRQIDWDLLGDTFISNPQIVKLSAAAAIGAVSLTVNPLPVDLNIGDNLDFGVLESVSVVVGAAGASAAATTVPVDALSGPIPAGTVLHFGTNKFAVLSAAAAAAATSLTTLAIPTALVDNDAAVFEGGVQTAVVDAYAAKGSTTVVVEDLALAIASGAEATVMGDDENPVTGRQVKAGTVVDLMPNGKVVPSALDTAGATAYGIMYTNADEDSDTDAASGYGVLRSAYVYENLLPEAASGVQQVETLTVSGTATATTNLPVTVRAAGSSALVDGKIVQVPITTTDDAAAVAGKIRAALAADDDVSAFFTISGSTTAVIATAKSAAANDATMAISYPTASGMTGATSVDTTGGTTKTINSTWKTELLARGGFWMFEEYSDNT